MKNKNVVQNILKEIRDEYIGNKDLLDSEPKYMKSLSICIVINAILFIISTIIYLTTKIQYTLYILLILFFIFFITIIVYIYNQKKLKRYYEKNKETISEICLMIIEDEAKKYNISKEELVNYMIVNYRHRDYVIVIVGIMSIFTIIMSIFCLLSFEENDGWLNFILIFVCNLLFAYVSDYSKKAVYQLDTLDFLVKTPYKRQLGNVEEKIKSKIENTNKRG